MPHSFRLAQLPKLARSASSFGTFAKLAGAKSAPMRLDGQQAVTFVVIDDKVYRQGKTHYTEAGHVVLKEGT